MTTPVFSSLTTSDGLNLHLKNWPLAQAKGQVLIVHGMGEHSGRYQHVADFYQQHGFGVWAYDQRGHGRSEGPKGHAPSLDALLDDLDLVIKQVKSNALDLPLVLRGHSMGGNVVLNYATRRKFEAQALVLTGPWIQLAFAPPAWKVKAAKWLNTLMPGLTLKNDLDVTKISTDPAVVQAYVDDPLVHDRISASMGYNLMEAANFLNQWKGEMPTSTLIMHGAADQITSCPASEAFAHRNTGKVQFKAWEGLYHEIHNEAAQLEILQFEMQFLTNCGLI
jgi:alpha-beta hydrolase superfamily lysophospholipase